MMWMQICHVPRGHTGDTKLSNFSCGPPR
jgi:hypothetical protein